MPFPVSISFSSNTYPVRPPPSMSSASTSQTSQKPRRNPSVASGVKRPRPVGLWKARRYGPALSTPPEAPTPLPHADSPHRPNPPESDSDSDKDSCSSLFSCNQRCSKPAGLDTPLSTDLDDTPHSRTLVTKHHSQQHQLRQDYFSAKPQPADESSDDDSANWTARTKIMDVSTTAGPGDSSPTNTAFTYEDWLDLKQLFAKACEQYDFDDPAETLPLLRGIIHECHRCLLAYHDPSVLFNFSSAPAAESKLAKESGGRTPPSGQPSRRTRGPPAYLTDIPTSFHTLLGTTLFFFGNSIAANPELAQPGEPSIPVPYWIAALDIFETGENLPSRTESSSAVTPYRYETSPTDYTPLPPREDWRMGVMWGRTLVALASEMADRHRHNPIPPPEPEQYTSPFPTNTDYLKTGTIWDDEPEWPSESIFGVIVARRPPITRRMMLNDATPHEILQIAMDHFSRGIFHMPHSSTTSGPPSRQNVTPPFSRSKTLYEIADEVTLLTEKLPNPEERKEWAVYADSILDQINASQTHKFHGPGPASASTSTAKETTDTRPVITDGLLAKARGRTSLVIGSTMAEIIEEKMDKGSENVEAIGLLMRSEEAQEARDALLRAIDCFERARTYIPEDVSMSDEDVEEDNDDPMSVDDDEEADDEQEGGVLMSAHGKQRRDPKTHEARRASRLEARRAARAEAQQRLQQEADEERLQLSQFLAEALCSLANLTESKEEQEEFYRRAEAETRESLFDDDEMDEDK